MLSVSPSLQIPLSEFSFTFARSGGPGGQNVNKVNSKAVLRWSALSSHSLPKEVRARFISKYANRLTSEGDLVLVSQKYRDQSRNVDDCIEKLRQMLASVVSPPKLRRPTKPSRSSKIDRVDRKKEHSKKKGQRRRPNMDD